MIVDVHLLLIWLGDVTYGLEYEGMGQVTFSTDKNMKAISGGAQYELPTHVATLKVSRRTLRRKGSWSRLRILVSPVLCIGPNIHITFV
jgi:hypothetical protein